VTYFASSVDDAYRGQRKRGALHRARHAPRWKLPSRARARKSVHRPLGQRLAGGGVHPESSSWAASSDGFSASSRSPCRSRSVVSLPGLADDHPMMCARAAQARAAGETRRLYRRSEKVFSGLLRAYQRSWEWSSVIRDSPSACARPPSGQRLRLPDSSERVSSPTGHWTSLRRHPRRAGHLVPGDAGAGSPPSSTSSKSDPAVATVMAVHRRGWPGRHHEHRQGLHLPGPARGAQGERGAGHPRLAPEVESRRGRPHSTCRPTQESPHRRRAEQRRNTSTRSRPMTCENLETWGPIPAAGDAQAPGASPTSAPISRTAVCRPRSCTTARRRRGWGSRRR